MGVAHLKRWHWILISLVVGLAVGYILASVGPEGLAFSGKHNSISQADFERAVARKAIDGNPVVKKLSVYPDGNKMLITCAILERSDDPKNPLKNGYKDFVLPTSIPFEPVADLKQTVSVGIHPAAPGGRWFSGPGMVKVNGWPRPVPAAFAGWKIIDSGSGNADPGKDATVTLALRPAKYLLTITAPGISAKAIARLSLKLNDHALPALQPFQENATMWQTTVTRDAFIAADQQVLHVARGDTPIPIREMRLLDTTYTVVDYLSEVAATHPQASYRVGWWTQPKAAYSVCMLASLLLVGGIWPTIVRAVSGPLPVEVPADLPKPPPREPEKAPTPTAPVAETRENRPPAQPSADDELDALFAGKQSATVPKLSAGPQENTVIVNNASKPDEKDFKGVYYPVRRGSEHGFTLVELLVVIGIIALLIGMLMPALIRARQESQRVQCMSNMRQVGAQLLMYSNQWKGVMFPPGLGDSKPPANRWPVMVFLPAVYNPPVLNCPSDDQPMYEHSYILNNHLTEHHVTYSNTQTFGLTPSEVIVMGEKVTSQPDYYMDAVAGDYTTKVDFYKHGPHIGSNYLYLDMHVESDMPAVSLSDLDPWDTTAPPTTLTETE
jgi:prepilin-type N-terminal cleavage/methylation domain-containing protein